MIVPWNHILLLGPTPLSATFPLWVEWSGERFYTPQFEAIDLWVHDSVCETLDGQQVEPDGVGPIGCPSWLLALGIV